MSDTAAVDIWGAQIRVCLERLSSPPEAQIEHLRELGVAGSADELALEFDDAFRPLAPLLEEIPAAQALLSALRRVDSALGGENLEWRADALASSPAWEEIRRLASSALEEAWPG